MRSPSEHTVDTIWGHTLVRHLVRRMLEDDRLPHALLLHGPDGVGKRSLAFALAKLIFSAGRRPAVSAPRAAPAPPPAPADDAEDLFGEGEDSLDLFAAVPEPVVSKLAPKSSLPKAPTQTTEPILTDARIDRLVARSYPLQYEDDLPLMCSFVDLNVIEPVGNSRSIKVEQIRMLQDVGYVPPVEGRYRVILIFGADTITPGAANSLLKLLEEPPSYLVLILVSDQQHRILETIRSRCVALPCLPLAKSELVSRLVEEERVDATLADAAASFSSGCPGKALGVIGEGVLQQRKNLFDARLALDRGGIEHLASSAHLVAEATGGNLGQAAQLLASLARDRAVSSFLPGPKAPLIHGDLADLIREIPLSAEDAWEEFERWWDCLVMDAHPFVPLGDVPLELALWPAPGDSSEE